MNLLSDRFWFTQTLEESLQITHSFLTAATDEDFAIKMTIAYLSREYFAENAGNPEAVARVLLEETEDDRATITKDGQTIQIQQATSTGTNGNDTLNGTSGDDTFYPLRGNDSVNGQDGNDLLVVDYRNFA